ncbi:MAG: hypothetical protein ABW328_00630, partial [Ilumatobacteraceae bacterium]
MPLDEPDGRRVLDVGLDGPPPAPVDPKVRNRLLAAAAVMIAAFIVVVSGGGADHDALRSDGTAPPTETVAGTDAVPHDGAAPGDAS